MSFDVTLDRRILDDLADIALDAARRAGASYADIRLGETRREHALARDDRLERFDESRRCGFGLRVLVDGAWGFCGDVRLARAAILAALERACDSARAARRVQAAPVGIERLVAREATWRMPMVIDPFEISAAAKADLLLTVTSAARAGGADFCEATLDCEREERLFANSHGARLLQSRTRVTPFFEATAVDRASGRFAARESLVPARGAGWEYLAGCGLVEEARRAGGEARRKLAAKPVTPGVMDVVIDPTNLWLTIHETVGHSTELDRVLGWEANFAGGSFVKPAMRNHLRFGSELMTIRAERSREGGLATIGFDDDGAPAEAAEFFIVEKGVFKSFQMAMGQAHHIGAPGSNGCAYADDPTALPIQRMPNISLEPGSATCALDDLIAGIDRGLYVVGAGSWSIDQQRDNFQFGGQLFYEICNGRLGDMVQGAAYQGRTLSFWNALDGLGDASTFKLCGTPYCGKAEPIQIAPVSHGAPLARFRGVTVIATDAERA